MTNARSLELHIVLSKLSINLKYYFAYIGNAHESEFEWAEFKIWVENYSDGSGN